MKIDKLLWRLLMFIWVRRARKRFGKSGYEGVDFNTANFQQVTGQTTGQSVGDQTARVWLVDYGCTRLSGGCHWSVK